MDRLTFVDEDGQVFFDNPAGFPEDLGFTIRELAENEEWETLDNIAQRLANCEQRLKHYKDLEEQGRLLRLPCMVGSTVYTINTLQGGKTVIGETTADAFFCALGMIEGRFGQTIFLTQQEAEAKLEEIAQSPEFLNTKKG